MMIVNEDTRLKLLDELFIMSLYDMAAELQRREFHTMSPHDYATVIARMGLGVRMDTLTYCRRETS